MRGKKQRVRPFQLWFFTEILGEERLEGASADAQSYWQGRFAACTFVGGFLGIGQTRNSWGRCPKPHKGRCPLTLQGAIAP